MGGLKDSRWANPNIQPVGWRQMSNCNDSARGSLSVPPGSRVSRTESSMISIREDSFPLSNHALPPPRSQPPVSVSALASTTTLPLDSPPIQNHPAVAELVRYSKIVRRMKWKLPYLSDGFDAATSATNPERHAEAELMFKLDFYEYYMLLERALVHLLGVFSIHISSAPGAYAGDGLKGRRYATASSNHAFHANVLGALDLESNPLHHILGVGEPRRLLGRAKQLRNLWKYVEENEADGISTQGPLNRQQNRASQDRNHGLGDSRHMNGRYKGNIGAESLGIYDVENMLLGIFAAFDEAFKFAERHVIDLVSTSVQYENKIQPFTAQENVNGSLIDIDWDQKDDWSFMVDAMDWEAV